MVSTTWHFVVLLLFFDAQCPPSISTPRTLTPAKRTSFSLTRLCLVLLLGTVGPDGVTNLAPYSFYTVASTSPPVVSVTHVNPRAGVEKDTLANLRETKECQVNLVTEDLVEIMNASCGNYPRNVSEFEAVGIESTPGTKVNAPGVAKALVRMECTVREILPIGNSHVMYLDVVRFAVHDSVSREGGLTVDDTLFTAVGKMGGNGYSKTADRLELVRPQI
ncbi:flavin reductase family protein [Aphanomyces euteiches]|nr:flavin reductase family protein [Aphanomyces euteiches]